MDNTNLESEILKNFGGASVNNLKNVLQNTDGIDYEIRTFDHSPYFDSYSIDKALCPNTEKFTILSINIQSINAKFDKLTAFLQDLLDKEFSFSAICIQETWLSDKSMVSQFEIPDYNLISQGKRVSEHGGLCIYIHKKFTYSLLQLNDNSELDRSDQLRHKINQLH